MKLVPCAKPDKAVKADEPEMILTLGRNAQGYYVDDQRYECVSFLRATGERWYRLEDE